MLGGTPWLFSQQAEKEEPLYTELGRGSEMMQARRRGNGSRQKPSLPCPNAPLNWHMRKQMLMQPQ